MTTTSSAATVDAVRAPVVRGDRLAQLEDAGRGRVAEGVAGAEQPRPPRRAPAPGPPCSAGRRAGSARRRGCAARRAEAASRSMTWNGGTFARLGHLQPGDRAGRGAGDGVTGERAGDGGVLTPATVAARIDCASAAPARARGDLCPLTSTSSTLRAGGLRRHDPGHPGGAVSSRAGLPSLLVYLLMGVALGESGFGIGFENAELAHSLGLRGAGDHPGRGRPDHQLARGPALDAARPLARDGRRRGLGRGDGGRRRTTCSGCPGSSRCCSARSPRPPTPRRCSRCSAWCRCRGG